MESTNTAPETNESGNTNSTPNNTVQKELQVVAVKIVMPAQDYIAMLNYFARGTILDRALSKAIQEVSTPIREGEEM